jgi:hypothetical protein
MHSMRVQNDQANKFKKKPEQQRYAIVNKPLPQVPSKVALLAPNQANWPHKLKAFCRLHQQESQRQHVLLQVSAGARQDQIL